MPDIFLSYSREDRPIAQLFAEGFEREGFTVWWDATLSPGEAFDQVTEKALREARAVVVLWSKQSVDSRWVRAEAMQAHEGRKLVPAMIESCKRPIMFELTHTADLSHWSGDPADRAWQSYVAGVRLFVEKGEPAAAEVPAAGTSHSRTAPVRAVRRGGGKWKRFAMPVALVAAGGLLGAAAFSISTDQSMRNASPGGSPLVSLVMDVAPADSLGPAVFQRRPVVTAMAASPDGATIVFAGETRKPGEPSVWMLYRRPLAEAQAVALPGTEGASFPFFSPDGKWIGFAADSKLKKVAVTGGPPIDICDFPVNAAFGGASWGSTGEIVFVRGDLWIVADSGGTPRLLLEDTAASRFYSPAILPDGQTVLFSDVPGDGRWEGAHVDAFDLRTSKRKPGPVLVNATDARYSPTGHLVFMRGSALLAVPFDARRVTTNGAPVAMMAGIMHSINAPNAVGENGMGQFALSASGTLVYAAGDRYSTSNSTLVRVDRKGRETKLADIKGGFYGLRVSSSGTRVIGFRTGDGSRDSDVWMYEIPSGTPKRLTSTGDFGWPLFRPDGRSITMRDARTSGIYSLELDGSSAPQVMAELEPGVFPMSWSRDGKWLASRDLVGDVAQIVLRPVADSGLVSGEARQLYASKFRQEAAEFSPDGRWITYFSTETGSPGVYVQPFPGPGEKQLISTGDAGNPAWSPDGQTLYYLAVASSPEVAMMAVDVSTRGEFRKSAPRLLFKGAYVSSTPYRSFDLTPDGQFIMVRMEELPEQPVTRLNVILGWGEELKRRVPSR